MVQSKSAVLRSRRRGKSKKNRGQKKFQIRRARDGGPPLFKRVAALRRRLPSTVSDVRTIGRGIRSKPALAATRPGAHGPFPEPTAAQVKMV